MCGRQPDKPFLSQAALVTVFITAEGSLRKRGGHWTLLFVLFDLLTKLSVFQQGFGKVLVWFCLVYFAREILSLSNVNLHKSFFAKANFPAFQDSEVLPTPPVFENLLQNKETIHSTKIKKPTWQCPLVNSYI